MLLGWPRSTMMIKRLVAKAECVAVAGVIESAWIAYNAVLYNVPLFAATVCQSDRHIYLVICLSAIITPNGLIRKHDSRV